MKTGLQLTDITNALQQWLEQWDLPVWREGCIPINVAFPCLTWQLCWHEQKHEGSLQVTIWDRDRLHDSPQIADRLLSAAGIMLEVPGGVCAIWPESAEGIAGKGTVSGEKVTFRVVGEGVETV